MDRGLAAWRRHAYHADHAYGHRVLQSAGRSQCRPIPTIPFPGLPAAKGAHRIPRGAKRASLDRKHPNAGKGVTAFTGSRRPPWVATWTHARPGSGPESRNSLIKIRVGYELIYDLPQPTPMIMVLGTHSSRVSDIIVPD